MPSIHSALRTIRRIAITTSAVLLLAACAGTGPQPGAASAPDAHNDWQGKLALLHSTPFEAGGVRYEHRRYVVSRGDAPACQVAGQFLVGTPPNQSYQWGRGNCPTARVSGALIQYSPQPAFFFDELLRDGRVLLPRAPRRIELLPGAGVFVEAEGTQLAHFAHASRLLSGPIGVRASHWHHEGALGNSKVNHDFRPHGRVDLTTGQVAPSTLLTVDRSRPGLVALVHADGPRFRLEILDAEGVRLGQYADFLPRSGAFSGIQWTASGHGIFTIRTAEREYDVILARNGQPEGFPDGRVIVAAFGRSIANPSAYVRIVGTDLYHPLGKEVPDDVVGVQPRDVHGNPMVESYDLTYHTSLMVRYTDDEPRRWGLMHPDMRQGTGRKWHEIAWLPTLAPRATRTAAMSDWEHAVLLARDGNLWQAYPMGVLAQGSYEKALAAPAAASAESFDAVLAATRQAFERQVAARQQRIDQATAQIARDMAAHRASEQAQRDEAWRHAVHMRRRADVARLVYGSSDPERWLRYAEIMGTQADLSTLERMAGVESNATRRQALTQAIAQIRAAKAAEARRARERESALLAQQRPQAPAGGGSYVAPSAPVRIDTSGYANIVRENFLRAQSGQTPWGRTCWGRNC